MSQPAMLPFRYSAQSYSINGGVHELAHEQNRAGESLADDEHERFDVTECRGHPQHHQHRVQSATTVGRAAALPPPAIR